MHVGDPAAIEALFDGARRQRPRAGHPGQQCRGQSRTSGRCSTWTWAATRRPSRSTCAAISGPRCRPRKRMRAKGGGAIVNIASVNARRPAPGQGVYSMTKAGIVNMTEGFAKELAPAGIRVNAVLPGLTDTKFASALTGNPKLMELMTQHDPDGPRRAAGRNRAGGAVPGHAGGELRDRHHPGRRWRVPRLIAAGAAPIRPATLSRCPRPLPRSDSHR